MKPRSVFLLLCAVFASLLFVTCTGKHGGNSPQAPVEDIHYCGRFDWSDASAPRFAWPGTAIGARFEGTGISVTLTATAENYFEAVIDGVSCPAVPVVAGSATYGIASGLPQGPHDALLVRRTEGFQGPISFLGFTVTGGSIVQSPSPWTHRMEVVGDSISAGYGVLGPDQNCHYTAATESAYVAYPWVAARELDAAVHVIAYSGKGVYQNYGGSTVDPLPALYDRTIPDDPALTWDFSFHAEAVLINLGTNDFSVAVDQTQFQNAYAALIQHVRSKHPAATLYCIAGGFMGTTPTTYITNAIAASGDAKTHLLELTAPDAAEGFGCDWHPSVATQARWGADVAARLRTDLGW